MILRVLICLLSIKPAIALEAQMAFAQMGVSGPPSRGDFQFCATQVSGASLKTIDDLGWRRNAARIALAPSPPKRRRSLGLAGYWRCVGQSVSICL